MLLTSIVTHKKTNSLKRISLCLLAAFCTATWFGCDTETKIPADAYTDSDGDGAYDFVETALGTDPLINSDSPAAEGMLYTVYKTGGSPSGSTLNFISSYPSPKIDVLFLVDTTATMSNEISILKTSLDSIINTLRSFNCDAAFGLADYRDFPVDVYGSGSDYPFKLRHRIMTIKTAEGISSLTNTVNSLGTLKGSGGDIPDSSWEALFQLVSGEGNGSYIDAWDESNAPPLKVPSGEETGNIGGAGFRSGAMPVVIWITDSCGHNSEGFPLDYYPVKSGIESAFRNATVDMLASMGAVIIGINSGDAAAVTDQLYAVIGTGSTVPPADGKCSTGIGGADEDPVGGQCPLLYKTLGTGYGLGEQASRGIKALIAKEYIPIDISISITDGDTTDDIDPFDLFIEKVEVAALSDQIVMDYDGDLIKDCFLNITAGETCCFTIDFKNPAELTLQSEVCVYRLNVTVYADHVTPLETRPLYIIIPPEDQ